MKRFKTKNQARAAQELDEISEVEEMPSMEIDFGLAPARMPAEELKIQEESPRTQRRHARDNRRFEARQKKATLKV